MNQVHAENSGLHVGKVKVDVFYHLDPNFILFSADDIALLSGIIVTNTTSDGLRRFYMPGP